MSIYPEVWQPVSQSCAVAKILVGHWKSNLADRMEDCCIDLAKVHLCKYENQTLEAFAADSRLYAKFDCPVAHQNFSHLATACHCVTGLP